MQNQDLNQARVAYVPHPDGDYQDASGTRYIRVVALRGAWLYTPHPVYGFDDPTPYTPFPKP